MCAIVDNNMRDRFFGTPVAPELQPLWKWIDDRKGLLVVGGRLRKELYESENARRAIQQWIRTTSARDIEDDDPGKVETETASITNGGLCKSNDQHVIALARVSGARLLCSGDQRLHADFGNPALISNPRGSVYQNSSHAHLLAHDGQCPLKAPVANSRRRRRPR